MLCVVFANRCCAIRRSRYNQPSTFNHTTVTLFILIAALMVVVALAFVWWPLLRSPREPTPVESSTSNLAVYRDQQREIADEYARGLIGEQEKITAEHELLHRVAEDVSTNQQQSPAPQRRPWLIALAITIAVPTLASLFYLKQGNPDALRLSVDGSTTQHALSDQQIEAMVEKLAAKLKENPTDAYGWVLLARTLNALGRYAESVTAYAKANELIPNNAALLADYADAYAMTQNRSLNGKPYQLIQQALAADPDNHKALALAATAELNNAKPQAALQYWQRLLRLLPPDSEDAKQVSAIIKEVSGHTAQRPTSDQQRSAKTIEGSISGVVELAPALAAQVTLNDSLFIFARAVEGPRMPLAVLKAQAKELPRAFTLDDAMSMAPNLKLSAAKEVRIEARISKSGNANIQPGDLIGSSAVVSPGTRQVKIIIDRVVQ